jgi:hypothetical protein
MGPKLSTTNWARMELYRVPATPALATASAPRLVTATKATKANAKAAALDAALAAKFAKWAASGKVAA